METKKISPSTMLRWAKTKSAFREQKNVKEAKKFSDLTPAKQKIIKEQYGKRRVKKSAPKKKPDPNSTGQKNLQALLQLGDLSEKISKEAKSQGTFLATIDNLLVFADGDKMKEKIRNAVKGDRGLENYGLAVYEVKAGDTIANIRLIASTDYNDFWLPGGKKMDEDDIELSGYQGPHSSGVKKIKGFMTGKNYKYLKSWKITKGIPQFDEDKPSWWDAGEKKITEEKTAKKNKERNELREKAIKLKVPQMKEFIKDNFYSYPFLSKMKKADLIKEIKTNDTWK